MIAQRLLVALLVVITSVGGGYWLGYRVTDQAWTTSVLKQRVQAAEALDQARQRADAASAAYLREHLGQETRYDNLEQRYAALRRRTPLVAASPCHAAPASPPGNWLDAQTQDGLGAPPSSPGLTWAAVRMWNGALSGTDAPAGACGLADSPEHPDSACATDAGLTLDDAWHNHALNAHSCAADRLRYQRLIDYLNGK